MKNVYVGNLPFHATEDDRRRLFGQYGRVDRASVVMDRETGCSRGFGFVEMPDDNEASNAIQNLDGADMGGRPLRINEARPREARPRGGFGGG
ncbi:MAG: RNA-binding protein, partial [Deltaproteobacteria bacterium]|nr:RNA-binding protein [Deltaproteobacteria bacterium]